MRMPLVGTRAAMARDWERARVQRPVLQGVAVGAALGGLSEEEVEQSTALALEERPLLPLVAP